MAERKGLFNQAWIVMTVLSIIFLVWTLFVLSRGTDILPTAFKLAGSPQLTGDIDEKALDFINMSMLKPLWEEIWIGIFGLFIAFGLKRKIGFVWTLGLFWGIMMIVNAVIQGGYELFILGWRTVCLQTYVFLLLGVVAVVSVLIAKKEFA